MHYEKAIGRVSLKLTYCWGNITSFFFNFLEMPGKECFYRFSFLFYFTPFKRVISLFSEQLLKKTTQTFSSISYFTRWTIIDWSRRKCCSWKPVSITKSSIILCRARYAINTNKRVLTPNGKASLYLIRRLKSFALISYVIMFTSLFPRRFHPLHCQTVHR